jgi:hypothetical protein
MSSSSQLHIIIPGICGPLAEIETLKTIPLVKTWVSVLSKARRSTAAKNCNDIMASFFSMQSEDDFPSAVLNLMTDKRYDPSRFYMHADPVHLQADIDAAFLRSSNDLAIEHDDAVILCEMLNQHFEQDDLSFIMLDKDNWFVSSKEKIRIQTTSLSEAVGRNVNFILPKGEDRVWWRQRLTEAQMLLHTHEVNQQRENSGLMSINSLWFYGSGDLANVNKKDHIINSICSNQSMFKGLADFFQCRHVEVPVSVDTYLDVLLTLPQSTDHILYLQDIEHLINYTDTSLWLSGLEKMLDEWVYPLLQAANKNNIKVTLYPCDGKQYQFSRFDYLKLWRRPKLENHISSY